MIGRDLLIGMSLGIFYLIIVLLVRSVVVNWYPDAIVHFFRENSFYVLGSPFQFMTGVLIMIYWSLGNSFLFLFILISFLIIFKKRKLAIIAAFALMLTLFLFPLEHYHQILLDSVYSILIIFVLLRYGILAATGFLMVYYAVGSFPFTLDPSRFYFPYTVTIISIVSIIAIYSFYIASGKQLSNALMSDPEGG